MDWLKQRGIEFSNLRIVRGLEIIDISLMLSVPHLVIVAFECGVIMQRFQWAEKDLISLMSKWEAETHEPQRASGGKR